MHRRFFVYAKQMYFNRLTLGLRKAWNMQIITQDRNVIKPTDMTDIHSTHTHAPDCSRVEMIRGLNTMKHRAMKPINLFN